LRSVRLQPDGFFECANEGLQIRMLQQQPFRQLAFERTLQLSHELHRSNRIEPVKNQRHVRVDGGRVDFQKIRDHPGHAPARMIRDRRTNA
jgi:hypothetical protein